MSKFGALEAFSQPGTKMFSASRTQAGVADHCVFLCSYLTDNMAFCLISLYSSVLLSTYEKVSMSRYIICTSYEAIKSSM